MDDLRKWGGEKSQHGWNVLQDAGSDDEFFLPVEKKKWD